MRLRALLLALLFVALILPLPTHGDSGNCSASVPLRWSSDVKARVSLRGGAALHASPGESYRRIATLDDGTALDIIGGPTCADGMWWLQAQAIDGRIGWIIESGETGWQLEPWPLSVSPGLSTPRLVP